MNHHRVSISHPTRTGGARRLRWAQHLTSCCVCCCLLVWINCIATGVSAFCPVTTTSSSKFRGAPQRTCTDKRYRYHPIHGRASSPKQWFVPPSIRTAASPSSTQLHLFRWLRQATSSAAATPVVFSSITSFAATFAFSLLLSYCWGRRSSSGKQRQSPQQRVLSRQEQQQLDHYLPPINQTDSNLPHLLPDENLLSTRSSNAAAPNNRRVDDTTTTSPPPGHAIFSTPQPGQQPYDNTPAWINFAFARVWALFQTNTKRLISDTIQPILDDMEHPPFVQSIQLVHFTPGQQSPLLHTIHRLPSRALAEVQYAARGIFASTSCTEFAIQCQLFGRWEWTVPVTVRNLDIDAALWIRTRLAPYEPFVTAAEVGFRSVPSVTFDLASAGIPITRIPAVRNWLVQLLTKDIPEKFVVPNVVTLDFGNTPTSLDATRGQASSMPLSPPGPPSTLSIPELQLYFPEQAALFDAMDIDSNGSLSVEEIYQGLVDWGYTAHDAVDTFRTMDKNHDDEISLAEFCQAWPELAASFVPDRYKGELGCFVRRAELRESWWSRWSDPRVVVELAMDEQKEQQCPQQSYTSKWDSQTSVTGGVGRPVFLQTFDFKSIDATQEQLKVQLQERWGRRTIGTASIPLASVLQRPNQSVVVSMTNGHQLWVELSYAEYVQDVVPRPSPGSQELSAATMRQHKQNQQQQNGLRLPPPASTKTIVTKLPLVEPQDLRTRKVPGGLDELPWQ